MNIILLLVSLCGLYIAQASRLNFLIKRQPLSYNTSQLAMSPDCPSIPAASAHIILCYNTSAIFLPLLDTMLFITFLEERPAPTTLEANTLLQGPDHLFAFQRNSFIFLLSVTKDKYTAKAFQPMTEWTIYIDNMMFWNEFLIIQESHSCKFYAKNAHELLQSKEDFIDMPSFNLTLFDCSKETYTLIPSNKEMLVYNTKLHQLTNVVPRYNPRNRQLEVASSSVLHLTGLSDRELPVANEFLMRQDLCSNFLSIFSRRSGHFYLFNIDPFYLIEKFYLNGRGWYGFAEGNEPGKCNAGQSTTLFYVAFDDGLLDVRSFVLTKEYVPGIVDFDYSAVHKNLSHITQKFGRMVYFNPKLNMFQAQAIPIDLVAHSDSQHIFWPEDKRSEIINALTMNISMGPESHQVSSCNSSWISFVNISEHPNLNYEKRPNQPFPGACIRQNFEIYCQSAPSSSEKTAFCTKCFDDYDSCESSCLGQYFERSCYKLGSPVIYTTSDLSCFPSSLTVRRASPDTTVVHVKREFSEKAKCVFKSPAIGSYHIMIRAKGFRADEAGFINIGFLNKTSLLNQSSVDRRTSVTLNPQLPIHSSYPASYTTLELKDIMSYDLDIIYLKNKPSQRLLNQLSCLTCTTSARPYEIDSSNNPDSSISIDNPSGATPRLLAALPNVCHNGNWYDYDRNRVFRHWSECPNEEHLGFCAITMFSGWYNVSLRSDYILPYCKIAFSLPLNTEIIEVNFDNLYSYEYLTIWYSEGTPEVLTSSHASPKRFSMPSTDYKVNVSISFYSENPEWSLNRSGIKFSVKYRHVELDIKDGIIQLLFMFLKLLVFFILVLNIVFFCARRSALLDDFDEEEEEEESTAKMNPYEAINYIDRHETELNFTEIEKAVLASEGYTFESTGAPTCVAEADCVICLDRVEESNYRVYLCGRHYVHVDCFKVWIEKMVESQNTQLCPMRCQSILLYRRNSSESTNASVEIESN